MHTRYNLEIFLQLRQLKIKLIFLVANVLLVGLQVNALNL